MPTRDLRHAIPQVYAGYKQLHDSALAPGALDTRTKELIALAIAVSKECDGCIAAHAHAAVQHGANPQEAAEAIGVTFLMNGGPATVYGARHSPHSRSSTASGPASQTRTSQPDERDLRGRKANLLPKVMADAFKAGFPPHRPHGPPGPGGAERSGDGAAAL